jgi:hypothetical protein
MEFDFKRELAGTTCDAQSFSYFSDVMGHHSAEVDHYF